MKYLLMGLFLFTGVGLAGNSLAVVLPEAKVTIKVSDITGLPVTNASISIGFGQGGDAWIGEHKSETFSGSTDSNGCFIAQARCYGNIGGSVNKEGCYQSMIRYNYSGTYQNKKRWEPWNPTIAVLLKEIKKPVSMYAKDVSLGVPEFEKALGFDLEKGDWVSPYGKGVSSDFVFYAELTQRSPDDFDCTLLLTFSNKGDGIRVFESSTPNRGSQFKSDYEAPLNGYLPEWNQFRKRRPEVGETNNIDRNRNYYFRVRTVLDKDGNVVSASYGKIYGDFLQFTYYLNPTPNDRNVEFDPDKNLFGGNDRFAP